MLDLYSVPLDEFAAIVEIACMKIKPVTSRDHFKCFTQIASKLIDRSRFARIITRRLDTASTKRGPSPFKAANIISLPAMDRNRDIGKSLHSTIDIYAHLRISTFSYFIGLLYCLFITHRSTFHLDF